MSKSLKETVVFFFKVEFRKKIGFAIIFPSILLFYLIKSILINYEEKILLRKQIDCKAFLKMMLIEKEKERKENECLQMKVKVENKRRKKKRRKSASSIEMILKE